jgi:hypothetical protein
MSNVECFLPAHGPRARFAPTLTALAGAGVSSEAMVMDHDRWSWRLLEDLGRSQTKEFLGEVASWIAAGALIGGFRLANKHADAASPAGYSPPAT